MQTFWHDFKHILRQLRAARGFTLTVVATLAIGLGLNAAIFTAVDCVLLRPLGYHDAGRIVALQTHLVEENRSIPRLGGDDYADLSRQVRGLEATAWYQSYTDGIKLHAAALYVPLAMVSPGFPRVMGVTPVAGRLFQPGGTEALVGAGFARSHFGSTQAALGQTILYQGALRPIVGVLPDGFSFPDRAEAWFQQSPLPDVKARSAYNQQAVGKRRLGVSPAQLDAELAAFSRSLQAAYPEDRHKTLEAVPLQEQLVGAIRPTLRLLMGSVMVILLIVLANITHLQLVRATRGQRELAVRQALGASRGALAWRALLEAALLATAGCAVALLLAAPALRLLVHLAPPDLPRLGDIRLNFEVLAVSYLGSLLLMGATAVLPVWRSWHTDPALVLKQDAARGMESRGSHRLRNGLLAAEVALTLSLSVAAVLLAQQLIAQSRQDLGFSPEHLVTLDSHIVDSAALPDPDKATTPEEKQAAMSAWAGYFERSVVRLNGVLATIAHTPGVASVAAIDGAPMGFGGADVSYAVRGRQVFGPSAEHLPGAQIRSVTPDLFSTLRMPLLRGRGLAVSDREGAPPVLLISRQLAQTVFPNQNPIGQQIMCGYDSVSTWWTIVGVAGDIRGDSPAAQPSPTFYVPVAQHPGRAAAGMQIVVRTRVSPGAMADILRRTLATQYPEIAVQAATMSEDIQATQRGDLFRTTLFAGFAAVSVLLAAVGIYGVTAYTVAQRRFEFGLRMALGASRLQLLTLVLRGTLTTALLGVAAGIALSLGGVRVLASVVGMLPSFDVLVLLPVSIAILTLALVAALLPARRAAFIDPVIALRSE